MKRRGRRDRSGRLFGLGRTGRVCALIALSVAVAGGVALATARTVMRSANNALYGRILVSPKGFTVYVFCPGTQARCTGHRAKAWPALIAGGRVVAARGSHLQARKLGTRKLSNGRRQVTYYGQPLYLYKGDRTRGQTHGEDRAQGNGAWFVISSSGRPIPPSSY